MWARLGTVLIFVGFLLIGVTTMTAYQPISAGAIYYNAYVLAQGASLLQGFAWILVGLGFLVRFYPETDSEDLSDT